MCIHRCGYAAWVWMNEAGRNVWDVCCACVYGTVGGEPVWNMWALCVGSANVCVQSVTCSSAARGICARVFCV